MRFLIVDDDQNSRRIIQLFLRPYGESVLAANGQEAIDLHARALEDGQPFDVIYLDVVMPGLSGLDVIIAIRDCESRKGGAKPVPVFMLTGEADISRINMAKSYGVAEYILKPIHEERLIQGLERLELISGPV